MIDPCRSPVDTRTGCGCVVGGGMGVSAVSDRDSGASAGTDAGIGNDSTTLCSRRVGTTRTNTAATPSTVSTAALT